MNRRNTRLVPVCGAWLVKILVFGGVHDATAGVDGWLHWRGPGQNGTSNETMLPEAWVPGGENHLWTVPLKGRGTPVIVSYPDLTEDRVYVWGFRGDGKDVVEVVAARMPPSPPHSPKVEDVEPRPRVPSRG